MPALPDDDIADAAWSLLYKVGGVAALVGVALIPLQMVVFIVWPPPETALGFFELFERNWLLGLLSLDLLYLLQNVLMILIYLSLYAALHRTNKSLMAIAAVFGLVGIAVYYPSNTAFEMLDLSIRYMGAETTTQTAALLAAGEGMLATYVGTAFDVYYVLNGITIVLIAVVMLRSSVFSRTTARVGLAAGVLMLIPSTAGAVGLAFALVSLVPWAVFAVLVARRLLRLAQCPAATPPARTIAM